MWSTSWSPRVEAARPVASSSVATADDGGPGDPEQLAAPGGMALAIADPAEELTQPPGRYKLVLARIDGSGCRAPDFSLGASGCMWDGQCFSRTLTAAATATCTPARWRWRWNAKHLAFSRSGWPSITSATTTCARTSFSC